MKNKQQCPNCGYPKTRDGQHYKGSYTPGKMCQHCGHYEIRMPEAPSELQQKKAG